MRLISNYTVPPLYLPLSGSVHVASGDCTIVNKHDKEWQMHINYKLL